MTDRELSYSLLKLDLETGKPITAAQIDSLVAADQRRIVWLSRIATTLWILAAMGALAIFVIGGLTFPLIAKLLAKAGEGSLEQPDTPFLVLSKFTAIAIVVGSASFVTLVAAGLVTLRLILRGRLATLRQINASLLRISEQLRKPADSGTNR